MKNNFKQTMSIAMVSVLGMSLLTGCGATEEFVAGTAVHSEIKEAGTVLLSVNPEIEVVYDYKGNVLEVEGSNGDGKNVVDGYNDYEGKACQIVVFELVQEIYNAGYFEEKVGGREKNIVLKLEKDSAYPDDDFLEDVAQGVRDAIGRNGIGSEAMTLEADDMEENGNIGLEKAKELVLAQLGLQEADFTEKEYELDDDVYELEFTKDGVEYEYEVHAVTGKVMEADYERNDDWKNDAQDDAKDNQDDDRDDANEDQDDRNDDQDDVSDAQNDGNDDWDDASDDQDDGSDDWDDSDDSWDDVDDDWDDAEDDDSDDDQDD